ncbi:hypothetical protein ACGE24_06445 [Corynebacterium kroppenstedtii]|uniref:hypothetical protein n=1 Tax=Corynebacterium sp. PCR 32 TaxID=3351342 RepID=UPI0030B60F21
MTIHVKVIATFFFGVFFSIMLAARYDSLITGVGFLAAVTTVCFVLNRMITKSD